MSGDFKGLDRIIDETLRKESNRRLLLIVVITSVCLACLCFYRPKAPSQVQAAQPDTPIRQVAVEGWMRAVGAYQELTLDTTTAQELTVPEGAYLVWLQGANNTIRYRLDDVDPTTTVGFELFAGDYLFPAGLLYHMRFISSAGTATLRAQPIGM